MKKPPNRWLLCRTVEALQNDHSSPGNERCWPGDASELDAWRKVSCERLPLSSSVSESSSSGPPLGSGFSFRSLWSSPCDVADRFETIIVLPSYFLYIKVDIRDDFAGLPGAKTAFPIHGDQWKKSVLGMDTLAHCEDYPVLPWHRLKLSNFLSKVTPNNGKRTEVHINTKNTFCQGHARKYYSLLACTIFSPYIKVPTYVLIGQLLSALVAQVLDEREEKLQATNLHQKKLQSEPYSQE